MTARRHPAAALRRATPRARRGMTLVELMVGLAIGLFLLAVMGTIYLGSRTTFVAQESGSRLQENGRFVMDTIANDVRMSGFRGCASVEQTSMRAGKPVLNPVDNTLNTPTALVNDFGQPVWGSHDPGGGWSPALTAPANALGASTDGDVLVVRRPFGVGWSLVAEMAGVAAPLTITPTANFAQGDLLMVADCAGSSMLQATNAGPGAAGSIEHAAGAAGVAPGVSTGSLARIYANDARVWRMQTLIYYLADSQRRPGEMALWVYTSPTYDGQAQKSELVTGVERMALTFGVDNDGADVEGNLSANRFLRADAVADWSRVVSVRVELLLAGSGDSPTAAAQSLVFAGSTLTPADRKLRTVMSTLVSLRNTVP